MCTASWLSVPGGYELFFSRDEARARRAGEPPRALEADGGRALAPRDGEAGGTWIAANEHGATIALLNAAGRAPAQRRRSRGTLVQALAGARDGDELGARLARLDLACFDGFQLLCVWPAADGDAPRARAWLWGEGELSGAAPPMPLASSSLGSEEARRRRGQVLARLAAEGGPPDALLERFHRSHAPARGPWSPCVHRPEVETVSLVRVEVGPRRIRMRYAPGSPCASRFGEPVELARRAAAPTPRA